MTLGSLAQENFQEQAESTNFGTFDRRLHVLEKVLQSLEDRTGQEFINTKGMIQKAVGVAAQQLSTVQTTLVNFFDSVILTFWSILICHLIKTEIIAEFFRLAGSVF